MRRPRAGAGLRKPSSSKKRAARPVWTGFLDDGEPIYVEHHPASPGHQTLVFVHGLASDGATWTAVRDRALARGEGVVLVDLPGFGRSLSRRLIRQGAPDAVMTADSAAAIKRVLVGLDLRDVTLVGHSYGATIVHRAASDLEVASRMHRVAGKRRIVLIAPFVARIDAGVERRVVSWFGELLRVTTAHRGEPSGSADWQRIWARELYRWAADGLTIPFLRWSFGRTLEASRVRDPRTHGAKVEASIKAAVAVSEVNLLEFPDELDRDIDLTVISGEHDKVVPRAFIERFIGTMRDRGHRVRHDSLDGSHALPSEAPAAIDAILAK